MKLVKDEESERQRLITEARQIHFASPVLLPMLERKRENSIRRLLSSYREGKHDTNAVAELYILESMLHELRGKLQILEADKGDQ